MMVVVVPLDQANRDILAARIAAYDAIDGARVGDYLKLWTAPEPCPKHAYEYTRFTHDWGDKLQTGGHQWSGGFYLSTGHISYSGGLDPGVWRADLVATNETREGSVWFFNHNEARADNGIVASMPFRVFTLRAGADDSGIEYESDYYSLCVLDAERHANTCGYWYTITRRGLSQTGFRTEAELHRWLESMGLALAKPLTPAGAFSYQRLLWKGTTP
jgi:hypothetical protein